MAQTTKDHQRIRELTALAEVSRVEFSKAMLGLQESTKLGRRVEATFRDNLFAWMGSAAAVGLLVAQFPFRKRKLVSSNHASAETPVAKSAGWLAIVGVLFQLFRPILQRLLADQVKTFAANRFSQGTRHRPVATDF